MKAGSIKHVIGPNKNKGRVIKPLGSDKSRYPEVGKIDDIKTASIIIKPISREDGGQSVTGCRGLIHSLWLDVRGKPLGFSKLESRGGREKKN